MRSLTRSGQVCNATHWRYVGGYLIASELDSDTEAQRYHSRYLVRMSFVELRHELRRVELAWAEEGRRLPPDDPRQVWLERRWEKVREALAREEVALRGHGGRV